MLFLGQKKSQKIPQYLMRRGRNDNWQNVESRKRSEHQKSKRSELQQTDQNVESNLPTALGLLPNLT
jgi:hypothetical protein